MMIDGRLPRAAVLRHLDRLAEDLAPRQLKRLRALAKVMDDEGRISLPVALEIATPGGDTKTRQDAFRQFRAAVKDATSAAGRRLELVSDGRKTPPEGRFCWFEGDDTTGDELAERSRRQAERTTVGAVVPPTTAEWVETPAPPPAKDSVVVYVSTAVAKIVRRRESEVIELLREQLAVRHDREFRVTSVSDIPLGGEIAQKRQRLRAEADVVLVLISASYLAASGGDAEWLAGAEHPPLAMFALETVDLGNARSLGLPLATTGLVTEPFSSRRDRNAKLRFIAECIAAITGCLGRSATMGAPAVVSTATDIGELGAVQAPGDEGSRGLRAGRSAGRGDGTERRPRGRPRVGVGTGLGPAVIGGRTPRGVGNGLWRERAPSVRTAGGRGHGQDHDHQTAHRGVAGSPGA